MANTKKNFTFTMTSNEAKRIERKHGDTSTIKWIGATSIEKEQMIMVDGHHEIILELAANLEIDNVVLVREMDHIG